MEELSYLAKINPFVGWDMVEKMLAKVTLAVHLLSMLKSGITYRSQSDNHGQWPFVNGSDHFLPGPWIPETGKYTLVGVVSYGAGNVHDSCGEWGAYTKVSRFLPFIKKTNY